MTPALLNSINYKDKLYKQWKKDEENQSKKREFTDYQKNLKNKLRVVKNRFDYNQINNADSKRMWQYVHRKLENNSKDRTTRRRGTTSTRP